MLGPLLTRLTTVALRDYTVPELGQIMAANLPKNLKIKGDVIDEIAPTLRGIARNAVLRAHEISRFCKIRNLSEFSEKEWPMLCRKANVLPYGLNINEANILKLLAKGSKSLQTLAAATGQTPNMIRLSLEPALVRGGFMKIGAGSVREITPDGMTLVRQLP
jgi:Holliday junction resolvasome RuvABC ATP-dependent DNA helicase subunit